MISSVSSAFTHTLFRLLRWDQLFSACAPPFSCVANPSPPHPDLGQAYLPPWGSAWLLLGSFQVLQAGNRSLDLYVAGIAERTLSVLPGLVTLGLAQAGLDPTPSEDSIWGLAGAGRRWEAGGI